MPTIKMTTEVEATPENVRAALDAFATSPQAGAAREKFAAEQTERPFSFSPGAYVELNAHLASRLHAASPMAVVLAGSQSKPFGLLAFVHENGTVVPFTCAESQIAAGASKTS